MRFSLSILCLILAAPITASAQEAAVPKHAHVVENCVVQYISKVDVPARAEGTLTVLKVDEGLTVEKDQVLAVIDDTAAQINVALKEAEEKEAILNATNEVNLNDAKNSEELARAEAEAADAGGAKHGA